MILKCAEYFQLKKQINIELVIPIFNNLPLNTSHKHLTRRRNIGF